jgi:hypothetical protein
MSRSPVAFAQRGIRRAKNLDQRPTTHPDGDIGKLIEQCR